MKNIKYILLIVITMFFSIINVYAASCTYGDAKLYFECTTGSNGKGNCTIGGTQSGSLKINSFLPDSAKPDNSMIEKCDTMYYYLGEKDIAGFYASYDDNPITSKNKKNLYEIKKMKDDDKAIINADLSKFNGKECYWKSNNTALFGDNSLAYVCKVNQGNLNCNLTCASGSNCEESYGINSSKNNFTNSDFINGNTFLCPSGNLYLNGSVSSIDGKISINGVTTQKSSNLPNIVFSKTNVNPTSGKNEPSSEGNQNDDNDNKHDDDDLDLDAFCQGNVLRVFTTIGWVFFIIKILIPLILIIFGVIDISKAVISAKDDEIKKSVKTLIIRIIAGMVIFFVPSILYLFVELVGDNANAVYDKDHGKFKDCTSCMLKPSQDYCSVKVGE